MVLVEQEKVVCFVNRMSEPTPDDPTPVAGLGSCEVRQVLSSLLKFTYIHVYVFFRFIYIYV